MTQIRLHPSAFGPPTSQFTEELDPGDTLTLTTENRPSIQWDTSDPAVATVSPTGEVTALSAGSATITVSASHETGCATVQVVVLQSLDVRASGTELWVGNSTSAVAFGTYDNGQERNLSSDVTWTSSDTSVATVVSGGGITAAGPGTTDITASKGTVTSSALQIKVIQLNSIAITSLSANMNVGERAVGVADGTFSDSSVRTLTSGLQWTSTNTTVAVVDSRGMVTALAAGTANITVSSAGVTSPAISLTVTGAKVSSLAIKPDEVAPLYPGQIVSLIAQATYDNNVVQDVTQGVQWSSNSASNVSVNAAGVAEGVATGSATITAKYAGKEGTKDLEVLEGQTETALQRFRIDVPKPDTIFHMGEPDTDFGFKGFSLKTSESYWLSTSNTGFLQFGNTVTLTSGKRWLQYAKKDMVLSSSATTNLASKGNMVVASGAGYGEDSVEDSGTNPTTLEWNPTDLNLLLDPVAGGVRSYDESFASLNEDLLYRLGFGPMPAVPVAVAQLNLLKKALAKLKAVAGFLSGDRGAPTKNSDSVETFLDSAGLLGLLRKTTRVLSKLDRFLQRPETVPVAGILIGKVKQLHKANTWLSDAYGSFVATGTDAAAIVHSGTYTCSDHPEIKSSSAGTCKICGKALTKVKTAYEKEFSRGWEKNWKKLSGPDTAWNDRLLVITKMPTSDVAHFLRPIRSVVRNLRDGIGTVADMLETIGQFLGLLGGSADLGVVSKSKLSLLANSRLFAYAPNGVHIMSAPKGGLTGFDKTAGWNKAIHKKMSNRKVGGVFANFLFGKTSHSPPNPSIALWSAGPFEAHGHSEVLLSAYGPEGNGRFEARNHIEVAAGNTLGLFARAGRAEISGGELVLGGTAEAMEEKAILLAQLAIAEDKLELATVGVALATDHLQRSRDELADLTEQREAESTQMLQHVMGARFDQAMAHLATIRRLDTEIAAKQLEIEQFQATLDLKNLDRDAKQELVAASTRVLREYDGLAYVSANQGWDHDRQARPTSIDLAALQSVSAWGGETLKAAAGQSVELRAQNPINPAELPSEVKIGAQTVEISVGMFKVTVQNDKVVIEGGPAGGKVTVDSTGVVAEATGGGKMKLTVAGVELEGTTLQGNAQMIQLG